MKKFLSTIIVFSLIMSTIAATSTAAFAGTTDSSELAKAIATVKKVIEIPDKLTEFNYYYDEENDKGSMVHLNWSDKERESNISATVSDKGMITTYYCYTPEFQAKGFAKITKSQAEKTASDYLKKLVPDTLGSFKLENSAGNDFGQDYNFTYTLYVNDVPCDFVKIRIGINKYVGKLSNFNYNSDLKDVLITEYPSTEKVMTKEEAKKIYISELGPELKYLSNYDYSKKTLKLFTAYETDGYNRAIDAKTGKVIKLYEDFILYRDTADKAAGKKEAAVENSSLEVKYTEEELKEIERAQKLIDKNEADKVARNLVNSIGSQKPVSSTLREDWGPNQEYIWYLNYEKDYVTLDAKDAELISFSCSREDNSNRDIGLERAKIIADTYLEKVCADKKSQINWTNESTIDNKYGVYNFVYTRQENGINFDDNSIYVTVDKSSGEVISYSRSWYDKVVFPKLDGTIDKERAFNIADNLGDFELTYKKDADGKVRLVYDFQKDKSIIIDAFKGVRLDYRGEIYKDNTTNSTDYTDISGSWAEKTIKELKNNGYYLEGEKFAPKSATTQIEFFKYLYSPEQNYYSDDEEFYKMLLNSEIITKEEINAKAYITRQEAAKYVTRYLGVDKLAKESTVFKNMYTDTVDKSYLGYASAAYAFGIMKGDTKGRFNGQSNLTHAETAVVLYNTIKIK